VLSLLERWLAPRVAISSTKRTPEIDRHSWEASSYGGAIVPRRARDNGSIGVVAPPSRKEEDVDVAKVSEISAISTVSFEDAIQKGLARASKTIRNIKTAWIKEQQVRLDKGKIIEYQVNMLITFVLDD
jgi:flavin-binding protein dodecin